MHEIIDVIEHISYCWSNIDCCSK